LSQSLASDFWSITQRLLVFEEPLTKWLHYQRSLKRIKRRFLPGTGWDSSDFNIAQLTDQIPPDTTQTNRDFDHISSIFSVLFAQEEAKRFNSLALQRWVNQTTRSTESNQQFNGRSDDHLSSWLEFNALSAPAWTAINNTGAWGNDPRQHFIMQILPLIAQHFPQPPADFPSDTAKWRSLTLEFTRLLSINRQDLPGNFLPDMLLIVEGATEVILLPYLAACLGADMRNEGVMFIAAGGANQVVKKYMYFKDLVDLPIFCLLDNDAQAQYKSIENGLRAKDRVFILKNGEIEDMINTESLVILLNGYLETLNMKSGIYSEIEASDFPKDRNRKLVLEKLWRKRELGKFDKVGFAKFIVGQDKKADLISENGKQVIEALRHGHSN
jgi:hypothetical protein